MPVSSSPFTGEGSGCSRGYKGRVFLFAGLGLVLAASWPLAGFFLDRWIPKQWLGGGLLAAVLSTLAATVVVATVKGRLDALLTRRFFPDTAGFADFVSQLGEETSQAADRSAGAEGITRALRDHLGARPCDVFLVRDDAFVPESGSTLDDERERIARAALPLLAGRPTVMALTDDGPVLATRIGRDPTDGGVLLLGPRRSGLAYNTTERRLVSLLADQLGTLPPGATAT